MNQITALLSLYSEIIALLVAASFLSLFIGWMLKRSSANRKLKSVVESWEKRYHALEETSRADAENLEEQLQSMANESRTLQNTNKVLTDSLRKNDTSIQKARAEAIELNRQHAETQERLQRVIQQKDREILELGNRISNANDSARPSIGSTHIAPDISPAAPASEKYVIDSDLNHADTVAISMSDSFDATVQMSVDEIRNRPQGSNSVQAADLNETLDDTADLGGGVMEEMEESTVALDDEALAFAQRSYPLRGGK